MPCWRYILCTVTAFSGACLMLAGCGDGGPPKHVVTGKITKAGAPLPVKVNEVNAGGYLKLWLVAADPAQGTDAHDAVADFNTGNFKIPGPKSSGIPAGKYKVCVEWFPEK